MKITLKYVNPAGEGKKFGSIVGQDDTKLMVKAAMVGRFTKGQTYEVDTESQTWGESEVQVVKSISGTPAERPSYAPPATNGNGSGAPWFMPFVSNTVAHAIAAGYIKEPTEIGVWAKAAKEAADDL